MPDDPAYGLELYDDPDGDRTTGPPSRCRNGGAPFYQGAIPFQTLRISENLTIDEYGNKMTYAVTTDNIDGFTRYEDMTTNPSLRLRRTIITKDASGAVTNTTVTPPGLSDEQLFIIISHGEAGEGAYPRNSNVQIPCDGSVWGATGGNGLENCDGDNFFLSEMAEIVDPRPDPPFPLPALPRETNIRNLMAGADYFDDFVLAEDRFARNSFMNSNNANNSVFTENPRLGIGTDYPQEEIHVVGNLRVDGTRINMDRICNENGGGVFLAGTIGRQWNEMQRRWGA